MASGDMEASGMFRIEEPMGFWLHLVEQFRKKPFVLQQRPTPPIDFLNTIAPTLGAVQRRTYPLSINRVGRLLLSYFQILKARRPDSLICLSPYKIHIFLQ